MKINTRIAAGSMLVLALAAGASANVAAAKGIGAEASADLRAEPGVRSALRGFFSRHDGHDDFKSGNEEQKRDRDRLIDERIGLAFGIGIVTAIDGDAITARSTKGDGVTWTVTTDTATKFIYRGDDRLEAGDRIAVAGTVTDGEGDRRVIDARSVLVFDADLAHAKGTIAAVDAEAKTVTVATKRQGDVKVTVDADTAIVAKDGDASFADLVVGAKVRAQGAWDSLRDLVAATRVRLVSTIR